MANVKLIDDSIFTGSKTLKVPETGEVWREFAIKIKGGIVALGILNPQEVNVPDEFLKGTAREFGSITVRVDFLVYEGKTVARIFVPQGEQPLYFMDHEIYVREQSSSMSATPEQVVRILSKFYK